MNGVGAGTAAGDNGAVRDVPISDDMIRLGQFLKLVGIVDVGGDVKELLADGGVRVNGQPETRRGRQLVSGDVVQFGTEKLRVRAS